MWFFRVIETDDHEWACRRGRYEFDRHPQLTHALEHLAAIACQQGDARLFVHRLDGTVDDIGDAPCRPEQSGTVPVSGALGFWDSAGADGATSEQLLPWPVLSQAAPMEQSGGAWRGEEDGPDEFGIPLQAGAESLPGLGDWGFGDLGRRGQDLGPYGASG